MFGAFGGGPSPRPSLTFVSQAWPAIQGRHGERFGLRKQARAPCTASARSANATWCTTTYTPRMEIDAESPTRCAPTAANLLTCEPAATGRSADGFAAGYFLFRPPDPSMLTPNFIPGPGTGPPAQQRAATIELDWDVRQKSRFSPPTRPGRTGHFSAPGTVVRGGDVLVAEDGSLNCACRAASPGRCWSSRTARQHGTRST